MKNSIFLPAATLILTLAFALAPAVTPPFMGYLPGQLPVDIGRAIIQPAGYAFSIWGLIYGWLILHAGFGLWSRRDDASWAKVRPMLIGALVLGTVWLAIAARWPLMATLTIVVMAGFSLMAFLRADRHRDPWLLAAPLSIFAGWLTAASLVSIGVILAGYGILTNYGSAIAILLISVPMGLYFQSKQPRFWSYGATLVWALIAVVVVNLDTYPAIAAGAGAGALTVAIGAAFLFWRARQTAT